EGMGIVAKYERLMERYLAILGEDGLVLREEDGWKICDMPPRRDPAAEWRGLLERFPAYYAELTILANCGERLAAILRGEADPLAAIFPEGSMATAEHLYQDSPTLRYENALAAEAVGEMARRLPAGRTLRVLEIGAGTGGLTAHALSRLGSAAVEYVFTDLSKHFLNRAEQRFGGSGAVEYRLLDIERNPAEQGFTDHSFDIIAASQVL